MSVGGKRALAGLVALIVLGALGVGCFSWPIDSTRVALELNSTVASSSGLHWSRPGPARFTLLPWPSLRIVEVELLDARNRSVLSAPSAEIGLWPQGLLAGNFMPMSVKLQNPTALIDLDAARDGVERIVANPTALLTRVDVEGGVAKVVSSDLGLDTLVENVDGWIQWTKFSRPLAFSMNGLWRGEPVALEGGVSSPLELRQGKPSGAAFKITAHPADLAFSGVLALGEKGVLEGDLTTEIRSLGEVEKWLGLPSAPPIAANEIGLRGKVVGGSGSLAFSEAQLEVGGQRFEGSLNLSRIAGKTAVSGSLAADTLDISALWGLAGPILDASGQWTGEPLIAAPSRTLDLDLRVSASHASWQGHGIDAAAASVLQRDRRLTIRLLDATVCQGELSGQFSIEAAPGGLQTEASIALVNGDLGAALGEWGVTGYTGRGDYEAKLRAVGASAAEIARSLSGSASLRLTDGSIDGVNFEQALRRSLRRPVEFGRDMAIGQTNFSTARARLDISGGQAQIVEARMDGPGAIVEMKGAIDIASRQWRARIEAMQASAIGEPSAEAARLTISLFGPWAAPSIAALANTD